jgi:abortive infection bacteriophage resistance protein
MSHLNKEAQEWTWWQNPKFPNDPTRGIWKRYILDTCSRHGLTEHAEVKVELKKKSDLPHRLCRECGRISEQRNFSRKEQQDTENYRIKLVAEEFKMQVNQGLRCPETGEFFANLKAKKAKKKANSYGYKDE